MLGFVCYSIFNLSLYFVQDIRDEYKDVHDGKAYIYTPGHISYTTYTPGHISYITCTRRHIHTYDALLVNPSTPPLILSKIYIIAIVVRSQVLFCSLPVLCIDVFMRFVLICCYYVLCVDVFLCFRECADCSVERCVLRCSRIDIVLCHHGTGYVLSLSTATTLSLARTRTLTDIASMLWPL